MMKIKTHILYITTIIVLVVLLVRPCSKSDKVGGYEGSTIDTLSFISDTTNESVKIDTFSQGGSVKIVYRDKIVKDTIYVRDTISGSIISMPIIQKYFSEPNRYDLWISGVEPLQVDKINVYNQVEYKTITNTITQAIYPQEAELYFGGGFCSFLDTFTPVVGVSLKTKRNTLISLDYGCYKGDNLYLGTIKFKLGKNKYK